MRTDPQTRSLLIVAAFFALLLSGCPAARPEEAGGPGPIAPTVTAIPTGPDPRALYEGFTPDHPWRAVLGHVGVWKIAREEAEWRQPVEGADQWVPFDVLVAEQAGEEVRVVAERDDLLYTVWILRDDLALVPVQQVVLASAAGTSADADEPGVQLSGGEPIAVLEQKDGWTHVRVARAELQAEGWLPDAVLGRIYGTSDFVVADERLDLEPAAGLELCETANGKVLAVLRPDPATRLRVKALGEAQGGWREILLPSPAFLVRGWVKADGLAPASAENPPGPTHTISAIRPRGNINWMQVPVAFEVLTAVDGDTFAVTTMGTKLVVAPDRAPSRTAVTLQTIWGDVLGWIKCEPCPEGLPPPIIDTCIPPYQD
jgi:hypothetical protein